MLLKNTYTKNNKTLIISFLCLNILFFSCKKKAIESPEPIKADYPKAFVVNGLSNDISIINLNNLVQNKTIQLTDLGRYPHHITLSPDGTKLAIANPEFDFTLGHAALHNAVDKKGGIIIIDTKTGSSMLKIDLPNVNFNAAFSPNGSEIWSATSTHSGDMYIYETNTGNLIKQVPLGLSPSEVIFSKDGKYAFIALSESSFVYVLDVKIKEVIQTIKVDLYPSNTWLGDDGFIYVENKTTMSINIIDPNTLTVVNYLDLNFIPGKTIYNQLLDELWICETGKNKVAYFVKKNNLWTYQGEIVTGDEAHSISFSKDLKKAFVVNLKGNSVSVIDTQSHSKIKDISVGNQPNGIVLSE